MRRVLDYLTENSGQANISFAAPGHKNRSAVFDKFKYGDFYASLLKEDLADMEAGLTEVSQDYYADLYGAKHSVLLTNGVGSGVIASILSCVSRGGKLILGRNSKQYTFDAMRFGDIKPVYVRPDFNPKTGLQEGVSANEIRIACEDNPDASAVLITSPNYYGILSDISEIADVVHTYGMTLIVDQGEGAHLKFFDAVNGTTTAAEDMGADIVVNAMDKTLLGMEGTAVVNICSDRVDQDRFDDTVRMFATTHRSNLLLGSLDVNEKILRRQGGEIVGSWMSDLGYVYQQLESISGVSIIASDWLDPTKINISLDKLGVSVEKLDRELRNSHIIPDMIHGEYLMLTTGVGNCREDYVALVKVVKDVAESYAVGDSGKMRTTAIPNFALASEDVPIHKEAIPLYQADGRVVYDPIITYPPGLAVICPGEVMNMEAISYISRALSNEETVVGVDDEGYIFVGE